MYAAALCLKPNMSAPKWRLQYALHAALVSAADACVLGYSALCAGHMHCAQVKLTVSRSHALFAGHMHCEKVTCTVRRSHMHCEQLTGTVGRSHAQCAFHNAPRAGHHAL